MTKAAEIGPSDVFGAKCFLAIVVGLSVDIFTV